MLCKPYNVIAPNQQWSNKIWQTINQFYYHLLRFYQA